MLDAYRDLIDDLLNTPSDIRSLLDASGGSNTSPEAMRLVAELRNRDRAILERVQAITREETPYLPAVRPSASADDEDLSARLPQLGVHGRRVSGGSDCRRGSGVGSRGSAHVQLTD